MNKLYRYQEFHTWPESDLGFSSELFLHTRLKCYDFNILRFTKCGCWIEGEKFVLLSGKKRYAYPTKEEALESFKRRKAMQIKILTRLLAQAKNALSEAKII